MSETSSSSSESESSDFQKYLLNTSQKNVWSVEVRQELPECLFFFSRACDLRGISSRSGVQLATKLLWDFNVVTAENREAVIDKSKDVYEKLSLGKKEPQLKPPTYCAFNLMVVNM